MSLELPGWVIDVFYFIDLPWPGVDEDELRGWGKDLRTFADEITALSRQSRSAVNTVAHSDQSAFLTTVAQHWDHHHAQIEAMRQPMHAFADALDVAADAVVVQKDAVIAAAIALATAVGLTQGEALVTFGLAEAEVPLEVEAAKKVVEFALQELENKLLGILINHAAAAISSHLNHTIGQMLMGGLGVANEGYALKTDTKSIRTLASTFKTYAGRTETTSSEAYRRSTNRPIETDSPGGKWPIAAVLEQALTAIAGDLFRHLPGTLHQIMEDTEKDLIKAADELEKADAKLAQEAPKLEAAHEHEPVDGAIPPGTALGAAVFVDTPSAPGEPVSGDPAAAGEPRSQFPPPGEGTKHLGTLDESRLTRNADGLITLIDGKPVSSYLKNTTETRAEQYRAACADKSNPLSKKALGDCIAVGVDRRTGRVYEGINGRKGSQMDPEDVHPTIRNRVDQVEQAGPYPDQNGEPGFPFPHPDIPLRHAEVKATNEALRDRQSLGLPDGGSALGEIMMHPHFVYTRGGMAAPFCANCHNVLSGVESSSGRFTGWPPSDDLLIPGVTS